MPWDPGTQPNAGLSSNPTAANVTLNAETSTNKTHPKPSVRILPNFLPFFKGIPAFITLVVALHALLPYWVAHQAQPDAPLSWLVMTRWAGDASYLPLVRFMADLNLGENVLTGTESHRGIMVFQFFSILPLVLFYVPLGAIGIIACDVVFHVLAFISYTLILRWVIRSFRVRVWLALAFKIGAVSALGYGALKIPELNYTGWDPMGFRIPNPLISLPTLYLTLMAAWMGLSCRNSRALVILCYSMVVLAQQNAYYTLQCGALCLLLCMNDWSPEVWKRRWLSIRWHVPWLVLCAIPLFIQLGRGSLAMKTRLGFYKVMPVTGSLSQAVELLPGVIMENLSPRFGILALGVLLWVWSRKQKPQNHPFEKWIKFIVMLTASGYLAMPLLSFVGRFNLHT
jgi:hypothetical protein